MVKEQGSGVISQAVLQFKLAKALKWMVRLPIISCSTVDPMILVGEIGFSGLFIDYQEGGLMEARNHNRTYM